MRMFKIVSSLLLAFLLLNVAKFEQVDGRSLANDDGENDNVNIVPKQMVDSGDSSDSDVDDDDDDSMDDDGVIPVIQERGLFAGENGDKRAFSITQKRIFSALGKAIGNLFNRGPNVGGLEKIKNSARHIKQSKSGRRITNQYAKNGGFRQAERDFNSLRPQNVRSIGNGGKVGKVGDYTVNVRTTSSGGAPTLEYFKTSNRNNVVKIRYDK